MVGVVGVVLIGTGAGLVDEVHEGGGLAGRWSEDLLDLLGGEVVFDEGFDVEGFPPAIEDFSARQVAAGGAAIAEMDIVAEHGAASASVVVFIDGVGQGETPE